MKLQFKHQPFQAEAAAAVCDVFNGQPYRTVTYRRDLGDMAGQQLSMEDSEVGFRNQPFIPELTNRRILDNLRTVQRRNGLRPSDELTGLGVNLSIEMETGTGKTYTYVKTMYELNKRYGWSKYIIRRAIGGHPRGRLYVPADYVGALCRRIRQENSIFYLQFR